MKASDSRATINKLRGTRMVPGICIICPWHCPTEVYVRDDEVVYIRGNEYAASRESRCVKGIASTYLTKDPDRLLYPMKKNVSGVFKRITWDQAYSDIAENLLRIRDKYGPEAVCFFWHLDSNAQFPYQLFSELYGTPNCSGHAAACDQDRRLASLAVLGHPMPTRDFANSRFIMLWGADPLGSNESLFETRELLTALKRNAKLVVVDPIRSRTAEKAKVWLPIKPGTDGALALSMAYRIIETKAYDLDFCNEWVYGFEQFAAHVKKNGYTPQWAESITGISSGKIIALADEFARTKPAIMDGFKGLVNYSNGLDAFRTIFILDAITGNVDGPGNLILKELSELAMPLEIPIDKMTTPERPSLSEGFGYPLAPDIPTQLLPQAVLDKNPYEVKAAFFHIINPALTDPNTKRFHQMMSALDLSVTIDIYMSETAQLCDIVLPEASFYERAEVREGLWSGPQVLLSQPAISPRGESKPIYEIMKGLAQRMGYGEFFSWESWEEWARRITANLPIPFDELKEKGIWEGDLQYFKFRETGFGTLTGQIEAMSESFALNGFEPLPVFTEQNRVLPDDDYPFQLINTKMQCHCGTHTQNNPFLMSIHGENWAELNPADAREKQIENGDLIEINSPLGKKTITVKLNEGIKPGVLRVLHGHGFGRTFGRIASNKGTHINPLIGSQTNPVSGGIGFNECKVNFRKVIRHK